MQRIQDSGSNYQFYDHDIKENPPRSLFDLSYIHTSTFRIGALYPVYCQWTLPRSDYTINISDVFRSMPLAVPLMSRLRVFFHFYYSRYSELWDKGKVFVSKGANGQRAVEMPYIDESNTHNESLWRFFNLPQFQNTTIVDGKIVVPDPHDVSALHVSALPFMMYQKIYRDYYLDRNFQFNENGEFDVGWYPDEEEDFRIKGDNFVGHEITPVEDLDPISLTELRYRDFTPDYFISSVPRPQLGEPVGISLAGSAPVVVSGSGYGINYDYLDYNGYHFTGLSANLGDSHYQGIGSSNGYGFSTGDGTGIDPTRASYNNTNYADHTPPSSRSPLVVNLSDISAVTIDQLRLLNCNQIEMEKMARCSDGFYGTFMDAFFGDQPKSAYSMRPQYIGGTYQPIIISDVVQTSATVDTQSQTSVQGNQTGKGFSSDENANIGHIYSDDFGIIMGIMSIMPDTYYAQGIERQWTVKTQDDIYLPDRAGLSMQEIRTKELFASRTDATANDVILSYQNRYDEYRFRANCVSGYVGDHSQKEFSSYIQTRWFDSAPTYSQQFATTKDNVDMEQWFAKNLEPPFIGQIYFDVRAVQPMPYRAIPQGLFGL